MDYITPEQAAAAGKELTFEKVWVALMESRRQMAELRAELRESQLETQKQLKESQLVTQKRMDESQQRIEKNMADLDTKLSRSLGGLGNSLGRLTEALFSSDLAEKFNEYGYPFTTQANRKRFREGGKIIAEVDSILENGLYVMLVEIKTYPTVDEVNEHLDRIEIVRKYMDLQGDKRKILGAVAGGNVPENVLKYAQRKGLFVIVQTGNSLTIADMPPGFKAREW